MLKENWKSLWVSLALNAKHTSMLTASSNQALLDQMRDVRSDRNNWVLCLSRAQGNIYIYTYIYIWMVVWLQLTRNLDYQNSGTAKVIHMAPNLVLKCSEQNFRCIYGTDQCCTFNHNTFLQLTKSTVLPITLHCQALVSQVVQENP